MRANIGFILIGLGLIGAYIALGGKFGRGSTTSPKPSPALSPNASKGVGVPLINGQAAIPSTNQPFSNNPVPVTGGASQPPNVPNIGSGGQSWQSKWTQFGHIIAISPLDRRASGGGYQ